MQRGAIGLCLLLALLGQTQARLVPEATGVRSMKLSLFKGKSVRAGSRSSGVFQAGSPPGGWADWQQDRA